MSDYITATKHSVNGTLLNTKHPMFKNEELVVKIFDSWIEISVPTLDYAGKTKRTADTNGYGWRNICLNNFSLPPGRYYIDQDESNEDLIVINFD